MLWVSLRSPSPHWWILWACCTAGTWTPVCMVLLCFSVQAERAGVRRGWRKTSTGHTHAGHVSRWESQSGAGYQGEKRAVSGSFMCSGKPIWAPPHFSEVTLPYPFKQFKPWVFLIFSREIVGYFLLLQLCPSADQWCYDLGFVPTGRVSSFSTLQIFLRHIAWLILLKLPAMPDLFCMADIFCLVSMVIHFRFLTGWQLCSMLLMLREEVQQNPFRPNFQTTFCGIQSDSDVPAAHWLYFVCMSMC